MIETVPSALPAQEDHRRYEQIWQRVSPSLTPYPAAPDAPREQPCRVDGEREAELLRGFLQDELADAQTCRCLAALAPTAEGRRLMRRLAADEAGHAKRLQAAYFLLTGATYGVTVVLPPQPRLPWRDRLRERWHEECGGAARYARAAEETADACLARLLRALSADEYRHAELLQDLLTHML